ncbi:MAG TPA: zf-HC2 domain-containing protein [Actinomycetota bacterium]|nr:zf-HC2 domain-containing protein [Actinomycetota bacterium]
MTEQLKHLQCSELLARYVAGDLEKSAVKAVENHLAGCEECSRELEGVRALIPIAGAMDAFERARLHQMLDEMVTDAGATPSMLRGGGFFARFAPALGVAAMLLVLVAGGFWVTTSGGGDDESPSAGRAEQADDEADGGLFDQDSGAAREAPAAAAIEAAQDAALAPAPDPAFSGQDRFTIAQLKKLGRSGDPFAGFAVHYAVEDVDGLQPSFIDKLVAQAPSGAIGENIRACITEVSDALPYALLPALAAEAEVDGTATLVLGFAWSQRPIGPLGRYMIWAWPDGLCDQPPKTYLVGNIASAEAAEAAATNASESP